MSISIRKANTTDVRSIVDFQLKMALETEQIHLDKITVTQGVEAVLFEPSRGCYYVAEINEEVAGGLLVTYEWSDWRNGNIWWIQSVYVLSEHRSKGVFKTLYGHLKKQIDSDPSLVGLRLYVDKRNTSAQKTYGSLGMDGEHYEVYEWMK